MSRLECLTGLVRAWLEGAVVPAPANLAEILELARRHRVAGLLHDLAVRCAWRESEALRELRRQRVRTALRNDVLLEHARCATERLTRAGLDVLRVKGCELLLAPYGDGGLRPMDDVDLVVRRGDLRAALGALAEAGYQVPARVPERWLRRYHFHVPLIDGTGSTLIELHFELLDRWVGGGLRIAWPETQAVRSSVPGLGRRLDPERRLLHLALHIAKHAPFLRARAVHRGAREAFARSSSSLPLLWLVDLVLVARHEPPHPARLLALARSTGVARDAWPALAAADALFGPGQLGDVANELRPRDGGWRRAVDAGTVVALDAGASLPRVVHRRAMAMSPRFLMRPVRMVDLVLRGVSGLPERLASVLAAARRAARRA